MSAHGRSVPLNVTLFDQADFFQLDGFTRLQGLTPSDLTLQVFANNVVQPWPLVAGLAVPDALVASGKVYLHEIPGAPGFYSTRWRPNAAGYWRLVLTYTAGLQIVAQDYDVVADETAGAAGTTPGGLQVSFIREHC